MPGDIARLVIEIDSNGVVTGKARLDDLTDSGKKAEDQNKKHRASLTELNQGLEIARKAFDLLSGAVTASVTEFVEAERAQVKLEAILRATGQAAGRTAQDLNNMANSLAGKTIFDDDAITNAQALMLTFKNVGGEIYDRTIPAVLDLSSAFGMDLAGASVMLGKALEDPTSGLTALRRVGVSFTDQQQEQIKALVDAGEAAKAQGEILDVLKGQVGGVAEAMGASASGSIARMENAINNLKESFGRLIATDFEPLIRNITDTIDTLSGNKVSLMWTPSLTGKRNDSEGMAGWTYGALDSLNPAQLGDLKSQVSGVLNKEWSIGSDEWLLKNLQKPQLEKLRTAIAAQEEANRLVKKLAVLEGGGTPTQDPVTGKIVNTVGIYSPNPTQDPSSDSGFRADSDEYQNNMILKDFRMQAGNKAWKSPTPEPAVDSGFRASDELTAQAMAAREAREQAELLGETYKKVAASVQGIAASGIAQGFQDIGAAMVNGASAGDAFGLAMEKMGVQLLQQVGGLMISIGLQTLANPALGGILNPVGWAFLSAGGFSAVAGGAAGAAIGSGSGARSALSSSGASGSSVASPAVTIHNYAGVQVTTAERQTPNGKELQIAVRNIVAGEIAGGGLDRVMASRYGVSSPGRSAS